MLKQRILGAIAFYALGVSTSWFIFGDGGYESLTAIIGLISAILAGISFWGLASDRDRRLAKEFERDFPYTSLISRLKAIDFGSDSIPREIIERLKTAMEAWSDPGRKFTGKKLEKLRSDFLDHIASFLDLQNDTLYPVYKSENLLELPKIWKTDSRYDFGNLQAELNRLSREMYTAHSKIMVKISNLSD